MIYLRSVIFYIGYIISAFLIGFTGCLLCPFLKLENRIKFLAYWPKFSNWLLSKTCNITVLVEGRKNIPSLPFVLVSNHQGQWETFYFQYFLFPSTTLLKKELLYIPFWGWSLALIDPIAINRKNPRSALKKVMKKGEDKLKKGFLVLFFPEGTRSRPGEVGNYARSGFELARKTEVPVLPVVHNSGDCWPAHKFLKHPGKIILKVGPQLRKILSSQEACKEVQDWTRKNLKKIRKES